LVLLSLRSKVLTSLLSNEAIGQSTSRNGRAKTMLRRERFEFGDNSIRQQVDELPVGLLLCLVAECSSCQNRLSQVWYQTLQSEVQVTPFHPFRHRFAKGVNPKSGIDEPLISETLLKLDDNRYLAAVSPQGLASPPETRRKERVLQPSLESRGLHLCLSARLVDVYYRCPSFAG
jgi:hypothetical protein